MRSMSEKCFAYALRFGVLVAVLGGAPHAHAQFCASNQSLPKTPGSPSTNSRSNVLDDANKYEPPNPMNNPEMRAKMVNDDRHKRMLADAKHILELAQALQDAVEKTPKDELSLDVVKKAAEMEKLAHDLKERMRG